MVIEYVLLLPEEGAAPDMHKEAALAGMEIIAQRFEDSNARTMAEYPELKSEQFKKITWDETAMRGQRQSAELFFSEPDAYYEDKPGRYDKVIRWVPNQDYAYAFLDPPYGNPLVTSDWRTLNGMLFSIPGKLEIMNWANEWATEWSNYFEEGDEWWGTFFWTVFDPVQNMYIVIAASATD